MFTVPVISGNVNTDAGPRQGSLVPWANIFWGLPSPMIIDFHTLFSPFPLFRALLLPGTLGYSPSSPQADTALRKSIRFTKFSTLKNGQLFLLQCSPDFSPSCVHVATWLTNSTQKQQINNRNALFSTKIAQEFLVHHLVSHTCTGFPLSALELPVEVPRKTFRMKTTDVENSAIDRPILRLKTRAGDYPIHLSPLSGDMRHSPCTDLSHPSSRRDNPCYNPTKKVQKSETRNTESTKLRYSELNLQTQFKPKILNFRLIYPWVSIP